MVNQNRTQVHKYLALAKLLLLAVLFIGLPLLLFSRYPQFWTLLRDRSRLEEFLMQYKSRCGWILFGIQILQMVISVLPGQVAQFCSGYLLGIPAGYVICLTGCAVGTVVSYWIAKVLGSDGVSLLFGDEKATAYLEKCQQPHGHRILFLLYLIPMMPKDLLAYVAGAGKFPLQKLLLLSLLGRTPAMLLGIAMGERLRENGLVGFVVILAIATGLILLCIVKRNEIEKLLERLEK